MRVHGDLLSLGVSPLAGGCRRTVWRARARRRTPRRVTVRRACRRTGERGAGAGLVWAAGRAGAARRLRRHAAGRQRSRPSHQPCWTAGRGPQPSGRNRQDHEGQADPGTPGSGAGCHPGRAASASQRLGSDLYDLTARRLPGLPARPPRARLTGIVSRHVPAVRRATRSGCLADPGCRRRRSMTRPTYAWSSHQPKTNSSRRSPVRAQHRWPHWRPALALRRLGARSPPSFPSLTVM